MAEHSFSPETLEKLATLPRLAVRDRELCDLELLLTGGFAPLTGFLDEREYQSVAETMRLPSGVLFPIPVVLSRPRDEVHAVGEEVILADAFGNPIAFMRVSSVYTPDKNKEARSVYGTEDRTHPGVRYLFEEMGEQYLGGPVEKIALPPRFDFVHLRQTPDDLKKMFTERGWKKVIGFQTRNPLQKAHVELMRRAAEAEGAMVLLHPVVGMTKEGDIDYLTRVRAYSRVHSAHMRDFAHLSVIPLAMRMAGPREALWHAGIRRNHGCTHFIVGRDHAGPGKDAWGKPFYEPDAASFLAKSLEKELGIIILPSSEIVFHATKGYVPYDTLSKEEEQGVQRISGTELRRMLRAGKDVPSWFAHQETIDELKKGVARERKRGAVVFFTGLSGAGKSTIAHLLAGYLRESSDREVTVLDGDVVRHHLSKGLGFSRADRDANIERIGFVAGEIAKHGGIAICSAIAPYRAPREKNRERITREGAAYIEVYISTPISVCRSRDTKGLYKKADSGLLKGFTGVDDPYEVPEHPDVVIDTSKLRAEAAAQEIMTVLAERGKI